MKSRNQTKYEPKTQIKKHEKKTNEKAVVPPNLPTFKQYLVPCSGFVVFERRQKFFI